jgi:predicted dehydrogenase
VGLGGIAGIHILAYKRLENVKIVAACDSQGREAKSYPLIRDEGVAIYSDLTEMLDSEELDMIDICAPTHLHASLSIAALERGLHVLCEKPMASTYREAAAIAEAAKKSGRIFMTAQVVRFSRPYRHLKATIESGELGALVSLSSHRRTAVPRWRLTAMTADSKLNGGCMIDLAIHDIDFIHSMLGMPDSIGGVYHPANEQNHNDFVAATLTYGSTAVTLNAGFFTAELPFSGGYRAIFENGYLEYEEGGTLISCGTELPIADEIYPDEGVGINIPMTSDFVDEISYFVSCVKEGHPAEEALPESTAGSLALAERIIASTAHI